MIVVLLATSCRAADGDWQADAVWHDGLVEKAVYSSSRVVYGKPRAYEMIVFTNKEQHDLATLTKADKSARTVEVWKHNQVEDIPTPNYTYHYVTTSHLRVGDLSLTRLDCSSQEFCGTSFKQFARRRDTGGALANAWDYFGFSYMPEAGRKSSPAEGVRQEKAKVAAEDSLPLLLRGFDFAAKAELPLALLPSQKSNRPTPAEPVAARVRHAGAENGAHKLELVVGDGVRATYWMAEDRRHVMVKYAGPEGQAYELKEVARVNYWTIKE
jgi:hypothetical protein